MTTSYTFRVLNSDGSVFGRGCFTYEGPPDGVDIQYNFGVSAGGTANKMVAFWYCDAVTGPRDLSNLINFNFTNAWQGVHYRLDFNVSDFPQNAHAIQAGQAQPKLLGPVGIHKGTQDVSNQGRKLEWPALAPATVTFPANAGAGGSAGTTPAADQLTIPAVDLVVVIDSSVSMKDEADALSKVVSSAIAAAKTSCPSDLRVTYLGIEGTFKNTQFTESIRSYLVGTCHTADSALRGRKVGELKGGGAQEDGGRAIEDVAANFNWRKGAARAIFFLGDEALEGGNDAGKQDQADVDEASRAIAVAKKTAVKVHTYLGTSSVKEKVHQEIAGEYARVAQETGGQAFTSQDALSGFDGLLRKVICGSKPKPQPPVVPPTTTKPFACCQEFVSGK